MSYATLYALWSDPGRADRLGRRSSSRGQPEALAEPVGVPLAQMAVDPGRWRAWAERNELSALSGAPEDTAPGTSTSVAPRRRTAGWLAAHHPRMFPRHPH